MTLYCISGHERWKAQHDYIHIKHKYALCVCILFRKPSPARYKYPAHLNIITENTLSMTEWKFVQERTASTFLDNKFPTKNSCGYLLDRRPGHQASGTQGPNADSISRYLTHKIHKNRQENAVFCLFFV